MAVGRARWTASFARSTSAAGVTSRRTEASSRINMTLTGTIARISQSMQFLANFPSSFQTITVRESGVNTVSTPNTGILLNRNVFSSTPIVHTAGGTAFVLETRITLAGVQ